MRRVKAATSSGASAPSMSRKSFPQALALTNGIVRVVGITRAPTARGKWRFAEPLKLLTDPGVDVARDCNLRHRIGVACAGQYCRRAHSASGGDDLRGCGSPRC